jgi:L-threonylcarbamoyladenylate synthase
MMKQEIDNAVKVLKEGGTLVYPTDTIWGIGCDATNAKAVNKIYKIKQREGGKTLIILLDDEAKIKDYVDDVDQCVYDLMESWNKPLTIIYPKAKNLAPNLIREDGTVAIRITKDEFSKELIREFGKPIVSTSANFSGDTTPLYFNMIKKELLDTMDYIVDVHRDSMNEMKASTIIKLNEDCSFEVIRP